MSSTDLETYEGQLARLDAGQLLAAGEEVRVRLFPSPNREGLTPYALPTALAYEPGNGTRYDLVFTPVRSVQQPWGDRVPQGAFDHDGDALSGHVLVSRVNGDAFAACFDLSFGSVIAPSYVAEKTGLGFADACALAALLSAVTGTLSSAAP